MRTWVSGDLVKFGRPCLLLIQSEILHLSFELLQTEWVFLHSNLVFTFKDGIRNHIFTKTLH